MGIGREQVLEKGGRAAGGSRHERAVVDSTEVAVGKRHRFGHTYREIIEP